MTVVFTVLYVLLTALLLLMVLRFLVDIFDKGEDAPLLDLVWMLTEPVVVPLRCLFDALGAEEALPFDGALLVSELFVVLLRALCKGAAGL